jgi:hypothetical protein
MAPSGIQKGVNGHFRGDHCHWKRTEKFDACVCEDGKAVICLKFEDHYDSVQNPLNDTWLR